MTLRGAGHHQIAEERNKKAGQGTQVQQCPGLDYIPQVLDRKKKKKVRPGLTNILEQVCELGKDGL